MGIREQYFTPVEFAKMFNIENKKGILSGIKSAIFKKDSEKKLYNAGVKIFGEGFENKENKVLIDAVKNATGEAVDGLEEVIGSKAVGKEGNIEGILTNSDNPVTAFARGISAKFNTLSLGITAGFLGYGLAKINEAMTKKKHLNKPGTNPAPRSSEPEKVVLNTPILNSLQANNNNAFSNFNFKG